MNLAAAGPITPDAPGGRRSIMSMTHSPEAVSDITPDLVARLRAGDARAGEQLVERYQVSMIRFCRGYLLTDDEAEDAVQDVFCKVLDADAIPDRFRPWLYKLARNHCLNTVRSRRRRGDRTPLPSDTRLHRTQTGHLTRLVNVELQERIERLLAEMPAHYAETLRLRYTEGLSRSEIAEVLGASESTVKTNLFEGLQRLRAHTSLLAYRNQR